MKNEIEECIQRKLRIYFEQLGSAQASQVLGMVSRETESSTIKFVLCHTNSNKSETAKILGISRATLNKKIALYNL